MNGQWDRLSRWNKQLDRAPLWQWAVLQASATFLAMAIGWAWIQSTHTDPWRFGRFGWWTHWGIPYIIGYTGLTTLIRYLQVRHRKKRDRTTW